MKKYNIEGGVDFFSELYKSLDNEIPSDDSNRCLITNELLTNNHVILNCGHKFNYIPLYHDLVNHKKKFNYLENRLTKLKMNEIRCPYCRIKQIVLLPYYEDLGLAKINGVNYYDPNNMENECTNDYAFPKCNFLFPNPNYDTSKEESSNNQKYLSTKCGLYGSKITIYDKNNPLQFITYDDTNHYCHSHKKIMIKQYKLKQKELDILSKKQAKEIEKQAKLDAKLKKKVEKQKSKLLTTSKKLLTENIVIGLSNVETQNGCSQILKTGPNKGSPCGCKIFTDNLCKRHLNTNVN
jgi:hypothetical protein